MKKPSRRHNNDGAVLPPASPIPHRQFGRTLLQSRRTGGGGGSGFGGNVRLRIAMTTLSVLTVAMASMMIFISLGSTSSVATLDRPEDHLSPLAHALSSSRRRNLSQLLPPEEENMKNTSIVKMKIVESLITLMAESES